MSEFVAGPTRGSPGNGEKIALTVGGQGAKWLRPGFNLVVTVGIPHVAEGGGERGGACGCLCVAFPENFQPLKI